MSTTDKSTFVATVLARLTVKDPQDLEAVKGGILNCFLKGFTVSDAVAYMGLCEEVNPDISEETALRLMAGIDAKYSVR